MLIRLDSVRAENIPPAESRDHNEGIGTSYHGDVKHILTRLDNHTRQSKLDR